MAKLVFESEEQKMEYAKKITGDYLLKFHSYARYAFYMFMAAMIIFSLFKICGVVAAHFDFTSMQKMLLELGSLIVVLAFSLFKL